MGAPTPTPTPPTPTPPPTPESVPTPPPTPTATDDGGAFGPPDASSTALREAADESILTEIEAGAAELLSPAPTESRSDRFGAAQSGWTTDAQPVGPALNQNLSNQLTPYTGREVEPYTGKSPTDANPNAYTGGQNVNPFIGVVPDKALASKDPTNLAEAFVRPYALSSPAARESNATPAPVQPSPIDRDMGAHDVTPDEMKAQVARFAEYDAQLAASQAGGGAATNLPTEISLAGSVVDQALRRIYSPVDAAGNPLSGQLNLYSGAAARGLAQSAPQGYMIGQTRYAGPADALEAAERLRLGIPARGQMPTDIYNRIWGTASRAAVRDAALSGSVATHNDLATLDQKSIQAIYELPTLRRYGGGMGVFGIATGGILIYSGTQQRNQTIGALGIAGGSLEAAGGAALLAGSLRTSAPLMQVGRGLGTAGSLATAPMVGYAFQDDLSRGQWFDATVDATSFASSGLTFGGTLAGSAALTEFGLVLGAFGIGVLVGTGIDKGAEAASKGLFGLDLSPSGLMAAQLTGLDSLFTSIWADPSKPLYTQTVGWKILQWIE